MAPEDTVNELLRRFATRDAPPESLAELFSEEVDFHVAGDTDVVPWIGRKTGRAGAADFWAQVQDRLESEHFAISDTLIKGGRVVVLGDLRSRLRDTGRLISSEFVFDFEVSNGQITRFRMFEDTFAVAQAFVPLR
ncbi:nuclear transport factor 2 family protein [Pseudonocardia sp. ICBG1122]|nr:nuclear transport factor 2 family protein [Pseudonocardia pini]